MAVRTGSVGPPIRANTFEPEVLRQMFNAVTVPGVYGGAASLAVAQHSTPNMSVDIATGNAVVLGTSVATTQGSYWFYNDALVNLAVAASHATLDRIDLVVAQIQDAFYAGGSNTPQLAVVTGTPAGSPVAPVVPASSLVLAQISVIHATASVLNANIADTRPRSATVTRLASVTNVAAMSGIGAAATSITGLGVTAIVGVGRRVRVTMAVPFVQAGGTSIPAGTCNLYVDGVTLLAGTGFYCVASSYGAVAAVVTEYNPTVGAHTYFGSITFGAGSGNLAQGPMSMYVDDVGPA